MHGDFNSIREEVPDQGGVDSLPNLLLHQPILARHGEHGLDTPPIHGEVLHQLPQLEGDKMSPYSSISLNTPYARRIQVFQRTRPGKEGSVTIVNLCDQTSGH